MSSELPPAAKFREESLAGDARTVAAVASLFRELTQTVTVLSKSFAVRQRGYFLPGEDEQLRQLLVSYWQARCALIEVVTSLQLEAQQNEDRRESVFLVAFAAALVLIDAARFLRKNFHTHHVIRDIGAVTSVSLQHRFGRRSAPAVDIGANQQGTHARHVP